MVRKAREVLKEGIKGEGDLWKLAGWAEARVGQGGERGGGLEMSWVVRA